MTLDDLRLEIDKIDRDLLELFLKRISCSERVAEIKKKDKIPVLDEEKENQILESISCEAGVYANEAKLLFSTIMDISRSVQYKVCK